MPTYRALITGSEGFVGKVLAAHLQAQGWEVVRSDFRGGEGVLTCDISDTAQVETLFSKAGPLTHIFHLAAQTFVPESHKNPAPTFQCNLIGTVNIIQSMGKMKLNRDMGGTPMLRPRMIFIGSADAYGPPQYLPVDELHPLNPPNPYAISKAAADAYCAYAAKAHDLDIVRMRPFNHSGAGQSDQFVLSSFAKQIADIEAGKQEPIIRVGNLSAARDFSHVEDVVEAYLLCAQHGKSGEVYNVCSGNSRTIQGVLESLLALARVKIKVEQDPARMRPVDVPEIVGCCEKLRRDCGWVPTHSFETLLGEILDYCREFLLRSHS